MAVDDFEALRSHLPLDDPDRHALDGPADEAFAHLAPGYPSTCNPADFAASDASERAFGGLGLLGAEGGEPR